MKALITGVGGFVGPYLSRHLAKNGFEVFGLDRKGSKADGCDVIQCDITRAAAVASAVEKVLPDLVFHLAGQSSVALSWKEPELTRKVNVGGTKNLLEAVAASGINPKILIVSSAEVYGVAKKFPTAENHPLQPVSPYGESRVEQEKVALEHSRRGVRIVITRSFNHTGPGQPSELVCSNFAKQLADIEKSKQQPAVKVGDLTVKRDFADVRDVVNAYLLLLMKGSFGDVYNVCSGKACTIGEVLAKLIEISGLKVKIEQDSSRVMGKTVPVLHGDNSKLMAATGWKPVIGFDQTLSDLLDYWRRVE
ncbi:GDP-mannose 4,6-dehydratase [Candidatus Woesearchaeota archaeon]|nr:GDP-mannose 4,6-dehydratase [Candidatus Woesearchaeota archaeon]